MTLRHISFVGVAIIILQADLWAQSGNLEDVFPLAVGNSWTFDHESLDWHMEPWGLTTTDSGSLSYTIVDNIVAADSTNWLLVEHRNVRRCISHVWGVDTCYSVVDTVARWLTEKHAEDHLLFCGDDWPFQAGSSFPFLRSFPDSASVRRFAVVDSGGLFTLNTAALSYGEYGIEFSFVFRSGVGEESMRCSTVNIIGYSYWSSSELRSFVIVSVSENALPPLIPRLEQNFPNPFNSLTHIEFTLPSAQFISLKVFDILGREVAELCNDVRPPGRHGIVFDATNLPSGTYFYRIQSQAYAQTKKLMLLR